VFIGFRTLMASFHGSTIPSFQYSGVFFYTLNSTPYTLHLDFNVSC
jgi:hypothetical protein